MNAAALLSIIVPVYNEEDVLPEFHRRLATALAALPIASEVIYVDDGSSDGSVAFLHGLCPAETSVAVLALSRNFGKEAALTAGLDHAQGDAVAVIDADLQDPPELIAEFVRCWQ